MPQHDTTGSKENQRNKQLVVKCCCCARAKDSQQQLYDNRKEGRVAMHWQVTTQNWSRKYGAQLRLMLPM